MHNFVKSEHEQRERTVREALSEYRCVILALSHHTQRWYMTRLARFAYWCEEQQILLSEFKPQHLSMYLDKMRSQISKATGQPLSTYTLNGHARSIRTFLYWCAQEPQTYISEAIPQHLKMPKIREKITEPYSEEHIKALNCAIAKNHFPVIIARDRAILAVLLDTGIRAGELCSLTLDRIHITHEEAYLVVIGKSYKERQVPLGKRATRLLIDYLENHRPQDCGTKTVFWGHRHEPLTINSLSQLFVRWGKLAQITGVQCCARTCRHTYAFRFLLQGGDLMVLSRLMGHTSVKMTETYLRAFQSVQARQLAGSVLDGFFVEKETEEAYLVEIETMTSNDRQTSQGEEKQWAHFFLMWHQRLAGSWKRTVQIAETLADVLPLALQQKTGEHPQAFLLRLGAALRKHSDVKYGVQHFVVKWKPGPRGMKQWQICQITGH